MNAKHKKPAMYMRKKREVGSVEVVFPFMHFKQVRIDRLDSRTYCRARNLHKMYPGSPFNTFRKRIYAKRNLLSI